MVKNKHIFATQLYIKWQRAKDLLVVIAIYNLKIDKISSEIK